MSAAVSSANATPARVALDAAAAEPSAAEPAVTVALTAATEPSAARLPAFCPAASARPACSQDGLLR